MIGADHDEGITANACRQQRDRSMKVFVFWVMKALKWFVSPSSKEEIAKAYPTIKEGQYNWCEVNLEKLQQNLAKESFIMKHGIATELKVHFSNGGQRFHLCCVVFIC